MCAKDSMVLGRSLTLQECILRAIRENPDLKTEQLNVLIGKEQILTELAAFAWSFEASSVYLNKDKPQNAREASATNNVGPGTSVFSEDNWRNRIGFSKRLTPGTTVDFGVRHSISEDDLSRNPLFSSFSTEHEVWVGATLTQPLLRGFGRESTLAPIDLARLQTESARMLTLIKAMNLVAEVAARYTDVVAAQEKLSVKAQNIERAEALVERNRKLVETGKGVEKDVISAELAVFQRKDDYLSTQFLKAQELNSLAALINLGPVFGPDANLIPVSGFGLEGNLPDHRGLIAAALRRRTDLAYYRTVIESAQINVRRAEDGAKPSLNLVGSAGLYGLDSDTGDAVERAIENQGGEVSVGIEFRMDLGRQAGRSAVDIATHQLQQARLGYRQAQNSIALEVDTAFRRVLNSRARLKTAIQARDLARRNLEAEERLLEQSKGDLYRVIERQQLYGDANANVVSATAVMSKAMIALWLSSGQLFERYGISEEWIKTVVEGPAKKKTIKPPVPGGSFGLPRVPVPRR